MSCRLRYPRQRLCGTVVFPILDQPTGYVRCIRQSAGLPVVAVEMWRPWWSPGNQLPQSHRVIPQDMGWDPMVADAATKSPQETQMYTL
ncbi:hypothetical protein PR002_g27853 [Phytophthora rubi]|uniref:Uncharacterized protein n=1 Tax=Phytophthora rubi TaxID=129364 RepID=A0A6A3HFE7_9STRA|nr:hypothetical protein PR002_g27853 [Phytophthora rubi]